MQGTWSQSLGRLALGSGLLLVLTVSSVAGEDDSGFLGRLFRFGGNGNSAGSNSTVPAGSQPVAAPYRGEPGATGGFAAPNSSASPDPNSLPTFGGLPETPPVSPSTGPTPRLTPRSRVSPAITTADPILTRFALGRSNDGSPFGMFLQIFADGTVVDSEGVHHLRLAELKPIVDTIQSGELYRLRGHCGAPSTDFIEYVHLVVYERRFGRLNAHSFSYSGNPQGCDHVVRHLHTALENLQAKISRPPVMETPGAAAAPRSLGASPLLPPQASTSYATNPVATPARGSVRPPAAPAPAAGTGVPVGPVIPLTPADGVR